MCAEFASLDPNQANIPYSAPKSEYGLGDLTNPDNVLSGQSRGTQSIGGSTNIQSDPSNQRLVVNDNTTNRVSFGRIGTGVNDWGMKVSQAGISVDTATNAQLIFNSSQDVFKIVQTGTTTINTMTFAVGSGASVFTGGVVNIVSHSLGFIPIVLANVSVNGIYQPLPRIGFVTNSTGTATIKLDVLSDNNSITFNLQGIATGSGWAGVTDGPYTIKYYLLQETAN